MAMQCRNTKCKNFYFGSNWSNCIGWHRNLNVDYGFFELSTKNPKILFDLENPFGFMTKDTLTGREVETFAEYWCSDDREENLGEFIQRVAQYAQAKLEKQYAGNCTSKVLYEDEIKESHPMKLPKVARYKAHDASMALVGERKEKSELVNLVRWLIMDKAETVIRDFKIKD